MQKVFLIGPQLKAEELLNFSSNASRDRFVFVDGGIDVFVQLNGDLPKDFVSIGDQDSSKFQMTVKLKTNKDESDLENALSQLHLDQKNSDAYALGFLGGRKDHEIFNLMAFSNFLQRYENLKLTLSRELIGYSGAHRWELNYRGLFSIITFYNSNLSIEGSVHYPLKNQPVSALSSMLLSNHADGDFSISSDNSFFIYKPNGFEANS